MELTLENITKTLENLEPDEYREAAIAISVLMVPRERKRWAVYCARQVLPVHEGNRDDRRMRKIVDAVDDDKPDILTEQVEDDFENAFFDTQSLVIDETNQRRMYVAHSVGVARAVNKDSEPDYAAYACTTADAASGHVLYPSLLEKGREILLLRRER